MIYKGSCHCGTVEFELDNDLSNIKQCNCSICSRKYSKMIIATKEQIKIIKGSNNLSIYQFGTHVAKHFFCRTCGIYTHHIRASDPNGIGVNSGCLESVDPFALEAEVLNKK